MAQIFRKGFTKILNLSTICGGGACLGLEVITHHNNFLRGSNDDNPPAGLLSFKLSLINPLNVNCDEFFVLLSCNNCTYRSRMISQKTISMKTKLV